VIELQREELAAARTERAHVSRSSLQLQSQLRQLQKQLARTGKSSPAAHRQEVTPIPSSAAMRKDQEAVQVPVQQNRSSELPELPQAVPTSSVVMPVRAIREPSSRVERSMAPTKYISVKPGDTLWSIAQKYRVQLNQLRTLNHLRDNRIVSGQALWLPDDQPMSSIGADKDASTQ
jgi:LysM repeat protein